MDLSTVPDDLLLRHINTLQNMLLQVILDFPHTGNYDEDVREMRDYISKWEFEGKNRGLEFKTVEERL
jgi:hypothetical protein